MTKSINIFADIVNSIEGILSSRVEHGLTTVYLYGYSALSVNVEKAFIQHYSVAVRYIDGNRDKQDGKRIYDLSQVTADSSHVIFVFSEHAATMREALLANGFRENIDFYVVCDIAKWWDDQKRLFRQQRSYKRFYDLQEQKLLMLHVLDRVDRLCKEHGLQYFIDSGSLIGAIRHKGFIPWDHDLDICMPLPDLYKLRDLLKADAELAYQSWDTDENYLYWSPRVVYRNIESIERILGNHILICNFGIDIFPLAGFGDDKETVAEQIRTQCALWDRWKRFLLSGNGSKTQLMEEIKAFQQHYLYADSSYVGPVNGTDMRYWALEKEKLFPVRAWEFEGKMYPVPNDYDARLKIEYGEYMQIPSKDEIKKSRNQVRVVCEREDI